MDLLKNLFKGDKVIWVIFLFLCLISIVEVFSATSTLSYKTGNHWGPITQHTIILIAGALIVWAVHLMNYRLFQLIPLVLVPLSAILLIIVFIMGLGGDKVNNAARWMTLFGIQFQPSELAKMAVIVTVSFILAKNQENAKANKKAFKWILIITAVFIALIAPENLSTAALLGLVVYIMMFIGRIDTKKMLKLTALFVGVVAFALAFVILYPNKSEEEQVETSTEMVSSTTPDQAEKKKSSFFSRIPTWKNRINKFIHPNDVPPSEYDIDDDAQIAHARIAIAKSNIIGKMPGNSEERDFLSQAFSDFIFAIIIEELGLIGGIFVIALYIWLLIRAGKIARKAKGNFATFLVMSIAMILVIQAMVNMCVAVGIIPVTGQPLPLISKGGTSTWINCAYIGMILSVSRYTAKLEESEKNEFQTEPDTELNKEQLIAEEEHLSAPAIHN